MARGIEVHNGKVVLGDIVKQRIQIDLGQDKTLVGRVNPLFVEVDDTSNWYPVDHASTIDGDMFVGWLMANVGEEPTGTSTILRLESNTKGITLNSFFDTIMSGVPQGNMDYFFTANPATGVDAWSRSGTVTNVAGYLKIKIGNDDRYIMLYSTPP